MATTQELFDRSFPGHYLRLVKKVKVTVVALVPALRGLRATLSASGVSRAVVARGPFDTVTLRRDPESIAFTSPLGATGLIDLEPEGAMLLPFEGMGVDAAGSSSCRRRPTRSTTGASPTCCSPSTTRPWTARATGRP